MTGASYKQSGVDIEAGNELVRRIKPLAAATTRPGVMGGIGGFGALFDLKREGYKDPILVSSTDGVGTKIKLAIESGRHDDIGIDLVAMCVNDLIVQGATPLFFLDYFACGRLDVGTAERVIAGISRGCAEAGCALVGGETAEMPGMYQDGDYDLAGFAVGAVEREGIITGERIEPGDIVLGLGSSGVHSNGYSLVRKLLADSGLGLDDAAPFDTARTMGDVLMTPTRLYIRSLLAALEIKDQAGAQAVRGLSHITGGGLLENIPRVLPDDLAVRLDARSWALPGVFKWLAAQGGLTADDLAVTFNCGIGMAVICAADAADAVAAALREAGEAVHVIGHVEQKVRSGRVVVDHAEREWLTAN